MSSGVTLIALLFVSADAKALQTPMLSNILTRHAPRSSVMVVPAAASTAELPEEAVEQALRLGAMELSEIVASAAGLHLFLRLP